MPQEELQVIRVPITTPTLWPNTSTNCYLLGNDKESVLIDAGYDKPETRNALEQAIKDHKLAQPSLIILTHAHIDHAPGVRQLSHWKAQVLCHSSEKKAIANVIAPYEHITTLSDGETLNVAGATLQAIHAPGHTAGQLNIYIPLLQLLFAGDNVVGEGTTWIGRPDGNMRDYLNTLERLKQLKLSRIGPGHGDWVEAPYEQIAFLIGRRRQREEQIIRFLEERAPDGLTVPELTRLIYRDTIHQSVVNVAERTTEAHLIKLIEDGRVKQDETLYSLAR
jgi:glyoxylase-like metal-dependent hydrolase (beta-lactamase superfamily II)